MKNPCILLIKWICSLGRQTFQELLAAGTKGKLFVNTPDTMTEAVVFLPGLWNAQAGGDLREELRECYGFVDA
jgi:hypothetical protein